MAGGVDLATLGVRIDGSQAVTTAQQIGSALDQMGTKGEAAKRKLESTPAFLRDFARAGASASQIAQLTGSSMESAAKAVKKYADTAAQGTYELTGLKAAQAQMALAGMNAGEVIGAMEGHANHAAGGIRQLDRAFGMMAASAVGANHQLGAVGGILASMGGGGMVMTGVIAGVAALGFVYETLTAKTRKAQEEQAKLTDALAKWNEETRNGAAGAHVAQLAAESATIADLTRRYQDLLAARRRSFVLGGLGTGQGSAQSGQIDGGESPDLATARANLAEGQRNLMNLNRTMAEDQRKTYVDQLAQTVTYFNKDASLRKQAVETERFLQSQLKALRASNPADLQGISSLAGMVKQLDEALHPKSAQRALSQELKEAAASAKELADVQRQGFADRMAADFERATDAVQGDKDALARLRILQESEKDTVEAYTSLSGAALAQRLKDIDAVRQQRLETEQLNEARERENRLTSDLRNDARSSLSVAHEVARKAVEEGIRATNKALGISDKDAEKAQRAIEKGFDHGTQMMVARLGDLLSSAISTGRVNGVNGKSASAGQVLGDLNAAAGSAVGNMIAPGIGGAIGGVVGRISGELQGKVIDKIFGLGKATDEAKRALEQMKDQVASTLASWRAEITGTAADQKAAALLELKVKYDSIRAEIEKNEAGRKNEAERNKDLTTASSLYQQALSKLQKTTNGVTDAMQGALNVVRGYKPIESLIYAASGGYNPGSGSGASGGSYGGPRGPARSQSGDLVLPMYLDGKAFAKVVLKNFQTAAQRKTGDSSQWATIMAVN